MTTRLMDDDNDPMDRRDSITHASIVDIPTDQIDITKDPDTQLTVPHMEVTCPGESDHRVSCIPDAVLILTEKQPPVPRISDMDSMSSYPATQSTRGLSNTILNMPY